MATDIKPKPAPDDGFGKNKKAEEKRIIIPRHIPSPVHVYTSNIGRSRVNELMWETSEWDLAESGRILDVESYVRRAFRNKRNLFLKEGCNFVGSKPERVKYIKKRMAQMETATNTPFKILMSQTAASLIRTSNAFWVKVRKDSASGGGKRIPVGRTKEIEPIAGYFLMAPETVRFKRDRYGSLLKYRQEIRGQEVEQFDPDDVIHFYLDKREGFSVGTPILVSVRDDIRALRRIEENVELLVYQHLFPLFHYKVGTEKKPAKMLPDGTDEVREVQIKVASMPSDGCWVTSERHSVEAIKTGSTPIAVEKVIEHFKQRIFSGLGQSTVDMGEGSTSNKGTAITMSRNLVDDTKADQKEFADQFNAFVIRELLLESSFPDATLLDEENLVFLQFNEIDLEARQAKENHLGDLYLKNVITHDEVRTGMGREPFEGEGWPTATSKKIMFTKGDGDWARTNYGLIERDKIVLQSLDEPGTDISQAEAKSRTTANKSKPAGGAAVSNKNKPQNQHGTRPSAKINKDSFGANNPVPSLKVIYSQNAPVQTIYSTLRTDIKNQILRKGVYLTETKALIDIAFAEATDRLIVLCQNSYRIGIRDAGFEPWRLKTSLADGKIKAHVIRYTDKLRKELKEHLERQLIKSQSLTAENAVFADLVLAALHHRANMIDNSEIMRAYNFGKASGFVANGKNKLFSKRHGDSSCPICSDHPWKKTSTDAIIYEELPPLHGYCVCTVEAEDI